MTADPAGPRNYDYIVVGSGAGGGPVAANLAAAGFKVLLLEAGADAVELAAPRLPEDYHVPAFHAFASENPAIKWDFFVRHYADDAAQRRDGKFIGEKDGVLYPRAGALGGCTAHNAMILVYPHNDDWDEIAALTADASWKSENMRKYFQRIEDCRHRPTAFWLNRLLGVNPSRHGFGGWLSTEWSVPREARGDRELRTIVERCAVQASREIGDRLKRLRWFLKTRADPNDWRSVRENAYGIRLLPLTTRRHMRVGSRERVLAVARRHPQRLTVELNALATRVLFDGGNRATGVEYLKGERLYRAHADPAPRAGEARQAYAAREVILAAGAFNTPQLLMLSGIGPRRELERHGIPVRVELSGVGNNLQDRYEISVVYRMKEGWKMMAGASFTRDDPQYRQWERHREGIYAGNGGVLAIIKKSKPDRLPDLFCLGLLANFRGYFPGYSKLIAQRQDYLSWVVLKARTENAGTVRLRSADPRDVPRINFDYFPAGKSAQEDLDAVVDGIRFVRALSARMSEHIAEEELPGKKLQSQEELRQFVKDNAWGHHASCTCPIGAPEKGGVVNGNFQVHGTKNLRIVDASVFPKIPGFFIVSAVYMIAEKASDAILADAQAAGNPQERVRARPVGQDASR
ncbi:MAG TPA: GMC family oxidoreductase [Candidatus Acidoferrales bacterium]|nr:GMC family oxidoreductase [Candidatus Acidoferrales bacterium]